MHTGNRWLVFILVSVFWAMPLVVQGVSVSITPAKQDVVFGKSAVFTSVAEGSGSYDYQWFFNNGRLAGKTGPTLQLDNVSTADQGTYSVRVTDERGESATAEAFLSVLLYPVLYKEGGTIVVTEGGWNAFEVGADGNILDLTYQWYFNGQPLYAKTNSVLVFERVTPAEAGSYTVFVSNKYAGVLSKPYILDIAPPDGLERWAWEHPRIQGNDLNALAYGRGIYVAVGIAGTLMTSTNATHWVNRHREAYGDLTDITYGDAGFVAVGWPGRIVTSVDGVNWIVRPQNIASIERIAFGDGVYIATASNSRYLPGQFGLVSTNGENWLQSSLPLGASEIVFGNGWFMAHGAYSTSSGLYRGRGSGDWTEVRGILPFSRLSFQNDAFLAFSQIERHDVAVPVGSAISNNGVDWMSASIVNPLPVLFPGTEIGIKGPIYVEAVINTVPGHDVGRLLISTNGLSWFQLPLSLSNNVSRLKFANGRSFGLGDDGYFITTEDQINWQTLSGWDDDDLRAVAEGSGQLVAISSGRFLTSKDDRIWKARNSTSPKKLKSISFGLGRYALICQDSNLFVSADAEIWTPVYTNALNLRSIAFGNGRFVVGGDGPLLVSTNGTNWDLVPYPFGPPTGEDNSVTSFGAIESIRFSEGKFVGTGANVGISTDGYNWMPLYPPVPERAAYGNGRVVITTRTREIYVTLETSNGFLNWSRATGDPVVEARDLIYAGGMFVITAADGFIYASRDGNIWSRHYTSCRNDLNAVIYTRSGTFLAVGNNGAIIESSTPIEALAATLSGRSLRIDLYGLPGRTYSVQTAPSLNAPQWQNLTTTTLLGAITNLVTPHNEANRFYRLMPR